MYNINVLFVHIMCKMRDRYKYIHVHKLILLLK